MLNPSNVSALGVTLTPLLLSPQSAQRARATIAWRSVTMACTVESCWAAPCVFPSTLIPALSLSLSLSLSPSLSLSLRLSTLSCTAQYSATPPPPSLQLWPPPLLPHTSELRNHSLARAEPYTHPDLHSGQLSVPNSYSRYSQCDSFRIVLSLPHAAKSPAARSKWGTCCPYERDTHTVKPPQHCPTHRWQYSQYTALILPGAKHTPEVFPSPPPPPPPPLSENSTALPGKTNARNEIPQPAGLHTRSPPAEVHRFPQKAHSSPLRHNSSTASPWPLNSKTARER